VADQVPGTDVLDADRGADADVLLSVQDLRAVFDTDDGVVQAVDGVSFDVHRGEVFSIVGESGSGKSVTAMTIMGLIPAVKVERGQILWKGSDLLAMREDQLRRVRGGEIAMIFQDPLTALNPVHTVGKQVGEMARIHDGVNRRQAFERAVEMLDLVGIPEPRKRARMYPHEFSGGMRQRAMIAMAITCKPDLLIADEPTTALDVTVQAQVLEVLLDIKDEIDSAIMLITHDLGVVAGLSDRVMVMYAGRQAEVGATDEIFSEHRHPYTLGLLASLPRLDDAGDEPLVPIVGSPPSLIRRPPGCPFHPRCRFARVPGRCNEEIPEMRPVGGDGHLASCHYAEELADVTLESLRARVDVAAEAELGDEVLLSEIEAADVALAEDEETELAQFMPPTMGSGAAEVAEVPIVGSGASEPAGSTDTMPASEPATEAEAVSPAEPAPATEAPADVGAGAEPAGDDETTGDGTDGEPEGER
jgi:glutathione transport system ATP-binding protein